MNIALITGASSGMGQEFVRRIDTMGLDELWLVSRRSERLKELADSLKTPCKLISADLSKTESIYEIAALLAERKPNLKILVNASGFGIFKDAANTALADQYAMIDLNARGLVGVTHVCLPYMERGSEIYQFGSLSSFQPVPWINIYAATKAFVLSYTRALNVELKPRGIRAMAVSPGWVKTEFFDHAVKDDTIIYYNRYYTSEQVITRALRDMKRGKDVSICGFPVRAQVLLTKLLPHKLVMAIWCKQQKQPRGEK